MAFRGNARQYCEVSLMVGPTADDDRQSLAFRLKIFFVVLVGASAGLITVVEDTTLLESGLATLTGLMVGVILVWIVFPGNGETRR
jgi:hypothetical protein